MRDRVATLYLHIGTSKTGTTAIQHFCVRNVETLARFGYCYPQMPFRYATVGYDRNAFFLAKLHFNAEGNLDSDADRQVWQRCMDRLSAKFRHYSKVVLSDEGVFAITRNSDQSPWGLLKRESEARGFDVRVIVYLRRQDQFLASNWAQSIKVATNECAVLRSDEMIAQADDKFALNYYDVLERIAGYFGRSAIDVRIYDRDRFEGGDVLQDFIRAIGLPTDANYSIPGDLNLSLRENLLEIKRIINTMPNMDDAARRRAGRIAIACSQAEDHTERHSLFTDEELRSFLDRYEESNRRLARDYLGMRGDASPFPPPEPQLPKWSPNDPAMYESIVRFLATAMFAQKPENRLKIARKTVRRWLGRMRRAMRLWWIERGLRPER